MTIRQFNEEIDLYQVAKIFRDSLREEPWNQNWSPEHSEQKIIGYQNRQRVVYEDGHVRGFIIYGSYLAHDGIVGTITELFVNSDDRGTGIGSQLLEHAHTELRDQGIQRITLSTHNLAPAKDFYQKHGYDVSEFISMDASIK